MSPTALVLWGDDVFVATTQKRPGVINGRIAEFRRRAKSASAVLDYGTRAVRAIAPAATAMQKIAPRDL